MWVRFPLAWFMHTTQKVPTNHFKIRRTKLTKYDLSARTKRTNFVRYSLNFRTIIAPTKVPSSGAIMFPDQDKRRVSSGKFDRVMVKQSYLLMTWFSALTQHSSTKKPIFFVKPMRQVRFTITKAPMAHKTFSQEQYLFRYFSLTISYYVQLSQFDSGKSMTLNESLYLISMLKSSSFFCETNLFLLQKYTVQFASRDSYFLTLK